MYWCGTRVWSGVTHSRECRTHTCQPTCVLSNMCTSVLVCACALQWRTLSTYLLDCMTPLGIPPVMTIPASVLHCSSSSITGLRLACTLECVTLGSFFQITLLQAGIYPRHTKEQEKYRSYMFYVSIFQRFWTFVLYKLHITITRGKWPK